MNGSSYLAGTDALGVLSEDAPSAKGLLNPYGSTSETPPKKPPATTPADRGRVIRIAGLAAGAILGAYLLRSKAPLVGVLGGAFLGWAGIGAAVKISQDGILT